MILRSKNKNALSLIKLNVPVATNLEIMESHFQLITQLVDANCVSAVILYSH